MKINAHFNQRVVVHSAQSAWLESPMKGVLRRPLDRVGTEVARATSIVKYLPNSQFSSHVHTGGEEFFVLDGVFQDEHGDYPAGSYVRNPPQSSHTPRSDFGCMIFVKLWQFQAEDRKHIRLDSNAIRATPHPRAKNVTLIPLYNDQYEEVSIQHWKANSNIQLSSGNGLEIFVLSGSFSEATDEFNTQSWLRLPVGTSLNAFAGPDGAKVWCKSNHLNKVTEQIQRVENANIATIA